MRATSRLICAFIQGLAWDAEEAAASFADTLKAATRLNLASATKGKFLTGTTSGGTSVTFAYTPINDMGPNDLTEICAALLAKCRILVAETPAISDAALVTALLAAFQPITRISSDFREYRA